MGTRGKVREVPSAAAKRGTVFHGTEWDWQTVGGLAYRANVTDTTEAVVRQHRDATSGLVVWGGFLAHSNEADQEHELLAEIPRGEGFHSPTAAMRELEAMHAEL